MTTKRNDYGQATIFFLAFLAIVLILVAFTGCKKEDNEYIKIPYQHYIQEKDNLLTSGYVCYWDQVESYSGLVTCMR